jgi:hypothetical protein
MVGDPKTLHDLARVDGAVHVRCRVCGHVELKDREEMIRGRLFHRLSCDWEVVCRSQRCGSAKCDSADVRVSVAPYSQDMDVLKRRRGAMITIGLALHILRKSAYSGSRPEIPVEAVRLALRALHPFVGDRSLLERYWELYSRELAPHETLTLPFGWIVQRLVARGYSVPGEMRT